MNPNPYASDPPFNIEYFKIIMKNTRGSFTIRIDEISLDEGDNMFEYGFYIKLLNGTELRSYG